MNKRSAGVLLHLSSLPSPYGIGGLGEEARAFVDFLAKSGQTYWQMLPIGPTGFGNSPYQSFSAFAGNPYFIDLNELVRDGLLTREECEQPDWGCDETAVDYEKLYRNRFALLRVACGRFSENLPADFTEFCEINRDWLPDYALFMTAKDHHFGADWSIWEEDLKVRRPETLAAKQEEWGEDIRFYEMMQYLFFRQWKALRSYASERGIALIGDIPIYVAADSADVWSNPGQFALDETLTPVEVAGCPPDAFCSDGQLWGNPLFRWDVMREDGYAWWIRRIAHMQQFFDVIRIDHFRGFDSYFAIPYGAETARDGVWREGPGMSLFTAIRQKLGDVEIIAEDLGFLTDSVHQLLSDSGYPGMKVLQFAFDERKDNLYQPHNYIRNCVVYTGTHDNDTVNGWMEHAPQGTVDFASEYLRLNSEEGYHWGMIRAAFSSVANLSVVPMQDLLGLGSEARMNAPSTTEGNWQWRMKKGADSDSLAEKLKDLTRLYGRCFS